MDKDSKEFFEYQTERAKVAFLENISPLHEIRIQFADKLNRAGSKDVVFFTLDEIRIYDEWLFQISLGLSSNYEILNRTNQHLNFQNRAMKSHAL